VQVSTTDIEMGQQVCVWWCMDWSQVK